MNLNEEKIKEALAFDEERRKELSQPMQILEDGRIVPVFKELSDEEILKEAERYGMGEKFIQDAPLFHAVKFAKAILKKASEK